MEEEIERVRVVTYTVIPHLMRDPSFLKKDGFFVILRQAQDFSELHPLVTLRELKALVFKNVIS